ncbi:hypothetical protein D3C87_1378990 [compost metagenome]
MSSLFMVPLEFPSFCKVVACGILTLVLFKFGLMYDSSSIRENSFREMRGYITRRAHQPRTRSREKDRNEYFIENKFMWVLRSIWLILVAGSYSGLRL